MENLNSVPGKPHLCASMTSTRYAPDSPCCSGKINVILNTSIASWVFLTLKISFVLLLRNICNRTKNVDWWRSVDTGSLFNPNVEGRARHHLSHSHCYVTSLCCIMSCAMLPEFWFGRSPFLVKRWKYFISRAGRFVSQTQIKGCLLPALGFLEQAREMNRNRYSWNHK